MTPGPSIPEISRTVGEILVASSVHPLLLAERDGTVTFANPAFSAAFGVGDGELAGTDLRSRVAPAHGPLLDGLLDPAGSHGPEQISILGDGGVILRRMTFMAVGRTPSQGVLLMGVGAGVGAESGSTAPEGRVVQMAERARKIAHDLNNTLSTITAFTDLLLADAEAGSSLAEDLEEVKRAALQAAELVRGLDELDKG